MTGIKPNRPIMHIIPQIEGKEGTAVNWTDEQVKSIVHIEELQSNMDKMHNEVEYLVSKRRERAIAAHNNATNIVSPNFEVGDLVLVRRATDRAHKLRFKWYGPARIIATHSPLVYSVQTLSKDKTERVHCARLAKYRDALRGKTIPTETMDLAARTESKYETVHAILDVGEAEDGLFFRVQWDGLPDKRDWTWHAVDVMYEDIPDMVTEFLDAFKGKKTIVAKIKRQLKLN